ncbi:Uncharacterised protein [Nocardia asteroides]|nr:hypothetical protein SAMN05444423_11255 [Nocardia asteroides]VEG32847.1 Uncharacterised protein [Nocardia asteroides]
MTLYVVELEPELCESEHDRAHADFDREVPDHG